MCINSVTLRQKSCSSKEIVKEIMLHIGFKAIDSIYCIKTTSFTIQRGRECLIANKYMLFIPLQ